MDIIFGRDQVVLGLRGGLLVCEAGDLALILGMIVMINPQVEVVEHDVSSDRRCLLTRAPPLPRRR